MAEFLKRPLRLLDRIYGFAGGSGEPNKVSLTPDILLVHDVSRHAERAGRPYMGYVIASMNNSPGGAVVETHRMTRVDDFQTPLGYSDESYELWILGASINVANADKADVTALTLYFGAQASENRMAVEVPEATFSAMNLTAPLCSYAGTDLYLNELASGTSDYWGIYYQPNFPVRVPPNGYIASTGQGAAAFNLTIVWLLWTGPLGTCPPAAG